MSYVLVVSEWTDEQPPTTNILRLIYQGRFLHGNVTLGGKFRLSMTRQKIFNIVLEANASILPESMCWFLFQWVAALTSELLWGMMAQCEVENRPCGILFWPWGSIFYGTFSTLVGNGSVQQSVVIQNNYFILKSR